MGQKTGQINIIRLATEPFDICQQMFYEPFKREKPIDSISRLRLHGNDLMQTYKLMAHISQGTQ